MKNCNSLKWQFCLSILLIFCETESRNVDVYDSLKNILNPLRLVYPRPTNQMSQHLTKFNPSHPDLRHSSEFTSVNCLINYEPNEIEAVPENERESFTMYLQCPFEFTADVNITWRVDEGIPGNIELVTNTSAVLDQVNNNITVTVEGLHFGRVFMDFFIQYTNTSTGSTGILETSYDVAVVFADLEELTSIYSMILGAMIIIYKFGFGCKCDLQVVWAILKKPIAPVVGFGCQFILMAPIALGIALMLSLPGVPALGLVAVGSCPGGGASNVFALLLDLNLELSLTMSTISTVAALGLTPLWIWLLGPIATGDETDVVIPVQNVLTSLLLLIIPVIPGLILANFKPKWAERVGKTLKFMTAVIGVFFISVGLYVYWEAMNALDGMSILACAILPLTGYILGILVGKLFCLEWVPAFTIGLETGFQNFALALLMLQVSLPRPEADIAGAVPMVYTFISSAMPSVVWIGYFVYNYRKGKKDATEANFSQDKADKIEEYAEKYKHMANDSNELNVQDLNGFQSDDKHGGQGSPVADNVI